MRPSSQKTRVLQEANSEEIPVDIIAQDIARIARGMEAMAKSRLTFETIVFLVSRSSKVGIPDTRNVLFAARDLAKTYLKPEKGTGK